MSRDDREDAKPYHSPHMPEPKLVPFDDGSTVKVYPTGAMSTRRAERYDLICPTGLRRLALRYAMGAERYGDNNWCEGMPPAERLNHLIRHVALYQKEGCSTDDNLAAIAWNAFALMHYEEDCKHHHFHEQLKAGGKKSESNDDNRQP